MSNRGIILSAPASGSGKTTITLGLLRALRNRGYEVRSAKSGPDYIDPKFHEAATGLACPNLDAWAMSPGRIRDLASGDGLLVIEGAMGLFDGAPPNGKGATADLAQLLGLPVVLVMDAARQGQSVAAIAEGFARHRAGVDVAAIILNRVGSTRHESILRSALETTETLALPSRHLGLVQAQEHGSIDTFLDRAAEVIARQIDLEAFSRLGLLLAQTDGGTTRLAPPAQSIAIARDEAFAFTYPHILADWRAMGAEISFFSPIADEAPDAGATFVFLPGGYPELHAGRLAAAQTFRSGITKAARSGAALYGECGGYMVMGDGMLDADGARHEMLGLLRLETSFKTRKLSLGYRHAEPLGGPWRTALKAHEFHYATTVSERGEPLFAAEDSEGNSLRNSGLCVGNTAGSFLHVIDRA